MTGEQTNAEFSLPQHLTGMIRKYFKGFDNKDIENLIDNVRQKKDTPKEVYYLKDLAWRPDENELKKIAPSELQNENKINEIKDILKNLRSGNTLISRDLDEILSNTELEIKIRSQACPNGGMVFQRGAAGQPNKAFLFISEASFQDQHKNTLPGIIAHEMGHLIEFSQRPPAGEKGLRKAPDIHVKNSAILWARNPAPETTRKTRRAVISARLIL